MKLGVGLKITEENLPKLKQLPVDFLVPYNSKSSIEISQVKTTHPHLAIKGSTLLSPRKENNQFLWNNYQFLQSCTLLESEQHILRYLLKKVEENKCYINQWELFNEIVKDNGKPRNCHLWSNEFYSKVVKEMRLLAPGTQFLYSDYNFAHENKSVVIQSLMDELRLDGVCMQFHLSIASINWLRYIPTSKFENCVSYYRHLGKKVVISEAGIRLNHPSITAMAGEKMLRDGNLVKDLIQHKGMELLPVTLKRRLGIALWQSLIHRCQDLGVDEFYCFKNDSEFERDEPSLIDRDFKWKLEQQSSHQVKS